MVEDTADGVEVFEAAVEVGVTGITRPVFPAGRELRPYRLKGAEGRSTYPDRTSEEFNEGRTARLLLGELCKVN